MVDKLKLLRGQGLTFGSIALKHPTLNEISEYGEQRYFEMIHYLCSIPSDYMVELDEVGVDYEQVSDFEFFYTMTRNISKEESKILFGDLDFQKFQWGYDKQNSKPVMFYVEDDKTIVIDEITYKLIVEYISCIHNIEKKIVRAGNSHTKRYLIDKEKRKRKRHKKEQFESILTNEVSALVNSEGFKYNYETIWNLPIYCFIDSLNRINKISNYKALMMGAYSGNVDTGKINFSEVHWTS